MNIQETSILFTVLCLSGALTSPVYSTDKFSDLGQTLQGITRSESAAISGDGRVVVGNLTVGTITTPFIWTEESGLAIPRTASLIDYPFTSGTDFPGPPFLPPGVTLTPDFGSGGFTIDGAVFATGGYITYQPPPVIDPAIILNIRTPFGISSNSPGFNYTQASLTNLITPGYAFGVNGDGSVVVGSFSHYTTTPFLRYTSEAFRWTEETDMVGIGMLPGDTRSNALAVSADGRVIVGSSGTSTRQEAFMWTEESGMVGLGGFTGVEQYSEATAVSGDGSVIVGQARTPESFVAFRWTRETGMENIGDLGGIYHVSYASDVSADGKVIVGNSYRESLAPELEAFRWTEQTGMVGIGDLPGGFYYSAAKAVNANGSVIVGFSNDETGNRAYRWTINGGMQTIEQWLAGAGVNITGWRLITANDVNAFGDVIVGTGENPDGIQSAWIARVGSGLIGPAAYTSSLAVSHAALNSSPEVSAIILNGAHHRTLLSYPLSGKGSCAWLSGDIGYNGRRDTDIQVVESGACHDFIPGRLRAGLSVGKTFSNQEIAGSGSSDMDGEYIAGEADYVIAQKFIISATAIYGIVDADIHRVYANAGNQDQSQGKTDAEFENIRIRVDWDNAFQWRGFNFTPRAAYTYNHTVMDGYMENGGGFPIRVDRQSDINHEIRVGLDSLRKLSEVTSFRGMLEGVHRVSDTGPGFSGEVIGLFSFSLPGRKLRQNWLRFGAELDHMFTPKVLISALVNGSTRGEDPDVSGGLNLHVAF